MIDIALVSFWSAAALIGYAYVGFPALVLLRSVLMRRPITPVDEGSKPAPHVSMIVAAYNEEQSVRAKIENVLSLEYPRDRLELIVASDGSTDRTNAIAALFQAQGVRLLALPRQGKARALNAAIAVARGDVLVFSDANSMFAPEAVTRLVAPFADSAVGGVAGDQRYVKSRGADAGERGYWTFDRLLKRCESAAGNVISATGAIYAVRRSLVGPVAEGVTDDFYTSTGVIARGYRLVFAEDAAAYEPAAERSGVEFGRKVRVMTRGLRGVWLRRELLNPWRHGFYAWQLFSHKVLRRLVGLPLVILAAATPILWPLGAAYQAAGVLQAAVYSLALIGGLANGTAMGRMKVFCVLWYFVLVNAASVVALFNFIIGRRLVTWETQRASAVQPAGLPGDATGTA